MNAPRSPRIPTLTMQVLYWGNPQTLVHPHWLPVSVDARDLNTDQLRAALAMVVARHESLRAVPQPDDDGLWQRILDPEHVAIEILDIANDDQVWRNVDSEPWPIEKARWVAGLIEQPARRLILKLCHGITDQVGLRILAGDLSLAINAVRMNTDPTWRPAASLVSLAEEEGSPQGKETLRLNNEYFRQTFASGWILKPITKRRVPRTWFQTAIVIDDDCMRRFSRTAASIGIPWQNLLRAAFLLAEETVQASGRISLSSLHHNRGDKERWRCVANFAVYLPALVDGEEALRTDPVDVARQVDAALTEAASHLPISDLTVTHLATGVEETLGRGVDRIHSTPNYELETSGSALIAVLDIPGTGNRVGEVREIRSWNWDWMIAVLDRQPNEVQLTLTEQAARCSAGSLRLLATCWLAAVEKYAGLTETPPIQISNRARKLRNAVGRWPDLELIDDVLVAVTASLPIPPLSD